MVVSIRNIEKELKIKIAHRKNVLMCCRELVNRLIVTDHPHLSLTLFILLERLTCNNSNRYWSDFIHSLF